MNKRYGWVIFCIGLLGAALSGCVGPKKVADPKTDTRVGVSPGLTVVLNGSESAVLAQSNQFRVQQGLKALRAEAKLMDIAKRHANNMAKQDRYGDSDSNGHIMDGLDPGARVKNGGYVFSRVAENVGWQLGASDPGVRMMEDWKKSPGHRKNLLIAEVIDTGVGAAKGKSGKWYFVQLFGKPLGSSQRPGAKLDSAQAR